MLPNVRYIGISFPPDFPWNKKKDIRVKILEKVVLEVCKEIGVPVFFMPEPIRGLNPEASNAGDYLGKMDFVGRLIDTGYTVTEEGLEAHVKTMFDIRRLNPREWKKVLAESYPSVV